MAEIVLDASAILAFLLAERGADIVEKQLDGAMMSAMNLAEVVTKLIDRGARSADAMQTASELAVRIVEVDAELALQIGALRAETAAFGLSLGDRACLALARQKGLPVLTGDRPWASLDLDLEIRFFR